MGRHKTRRCAVGLKRRKRNDALSLGKKRCAVGSQVAKRRSGNASFTPMAKWLPRPLTSADTIEIFAGTKAPGGHQDGRRKEATAAGPRRLPSGDELISPSQRGPSLERGARSFQVVSVISTRGVCPENVKT